VANVSLRTRGAHPTVDWKEWRRAGITAIHLAEEDRRLCATASASGADIVAIVDLGGIVEHRNRAARMAKDEHASPTLWPSASHAETDGSVSSVRLLRLRFTSELEADLGIRLGITRVSPLDAWVASIDISEHGQAMLTAVGADTSRVVDTVQRYVAGRRDGSAPPELEASEASVGFLLGDDAERLIAARADAVLAAATEVVQLARASHPSVGIDLDGSQFESRRLAPRLFELFDDVAIPVSGDLRAARLAVEAYGALDDRDVEVIVSVPSDEIDDSERLADYLDMLEGLGVGTIAIKCHASWLAFGADMVGRAVHRRYGRGWASPIRLRADLESE
jgi:hypothetical protein